MSNQMNNLAVAISDIVNDYIARGMTAEEACGVLYGASYRVMESSTAFDGIEPGGPQTGSPITIGDD